jgi:RNA polymerase sigma factor (sigma-70 family)
MQGKHQNDNIEDHIDALVEKNENAMPYKVAEKSLTSGVRIEAINKLPKARRQAIVMHYYDDMSYKEIGKALGISVSTVSTNILRAKAVLKEEWIKKDVIDGHDATSIDEGIFAPLMMTAISKNLDETFPDS